jgi:hypothetical protein
MEWIYKFERIDQPLNWAYHFGASGLVGLDIDPRNGGLESWAKVTSEYGNVAPTPKDRIEGRGWHYWFLAPIAGVLPEITHMHLLPGVELKHGEGYFFGPPSYHRCGKPYRWEAGLAPWETPFAPLPKWVVELAQKHQEEKQRKSSTQTYGKQSGSSVSYSVPNGTDRQRIYERARKLLVTIPPGIQGQNGSKPTYQAACALVLGFGLSTDEAMPLLQEYSARCVPPWSDKELLHKLESANKPPGERGYLLTNSTYGSLEAELGELAGIELEFIRPGPRGSRRHMNDSSLPPTDSGAIFTDDELTKLGDAIAADNPSKKISIAPLAASPAEKPQQHSGIPACHIKVFCHHRTEAKARVLYVACMCWDCLDCARRLKKLWTANVRQRLAEDRAKLDEPNGFVYLVNCEPNGWPTMQKRIRRRRGNYFRIRDGHHYLVVSTADPGDDAHQLSHQAAGDALLKVIEALPLCEKPISSSRAWKLPEEKGSGEWKRLGEIPRAVTSKRIRRIIEETGLTPIDKTVPNAKTLRHIIEFALPKDWDADKVQDFYWWLCQGETMPPEIEIEPLPVRSKPPTPDEGFDLTAFV